MSITPSPVPDAGKQSAADAAADSSMPGHAKSSMVPIIALAVVVVLGLGGLFFYTKSLSDRLDQTQKSLEASLASHSQSLEQLTRRIDQTDTKHNELQGEVASTKQYLGSTQAEAEKARKLAADLAKQQEEAANQLGSQISTLAQQQEATRGSLGNLSSDVTGVKGDVKSTQAELEKTKSDLKRVIGDLGVQSDLIAHTRGDLDSLRQRGERDYVEFNLQKSNKRQKVGSLQLELKKTDEKRQKYTLDLTVDDKTTEKKDKNVFEPVQFYQQGFRIPSEIVVQQIAKDRVSGYVSIPKVRDGATTASK
jgi:chromosome segregation ATPase